MKDVWQVQYYRTLSTASHDVTVEGVPIADVHRRVPRVPARGGRLRGASHARWGRRRLAARHLVEAVFAVETVAGPGSHQDHDKMECRRLRVPLRQGALHSKTAHKLPEKR